MIGLLQDVLICSVIGLAAMFSVVLVGRLVELFNTFLMEHGVGSFVINRLMFIGVVFHELSHALVAFLTGAKVTKIVCFTLFSKNRLGYVEFVTQGGRIKQAIQRCLVSCAPVLLGFLTIYIFAHAAFVPGRAIWMQALFAYTALSILCHMSMSKADLELYTKGALFSYPVLVCIVLLLRYLFF